MLAVADAKFASLHPERRTRTQDGELRLDPTPSAPCRRGVRFHLVALLNSSPLGLSPQASSFRRYYPVCTWHRIMELTLALGRSFTQPKQHVYTTKQGTQNYATHRPPTARGGQHQTELQYIDDNKHPHTPHNVTDPFSTAMKSIDDQVPKTQPKGREAERDPLTCASSPPSQDVPCLPPPFPSS